MGAGQRGISPDLEPLLADDNSVLLYLAPYLFMLESQRPVGLVAGPLGSGVFL
jgi:hypothetical protein